MSHAFYYLMYKIVNFIIASSEGLQDDGWNRTYSSLTDTIAWPGGRKKS